MLRVLTEGGAREEFVSTLDQICREGARRMVAAALQAEADSYVESFVEEVDEAGHRWSPPRRHERARRDPR